METIDRTRPWPPPMREDRFAVGDEVWWHIPTVLAACTTWAPDITKPVTIIAVKDRHPGPSGRVNAGHSQLVRVSPSYCPYSDEFDGTWLLPVGIKHHNDPAYCNRPDIIARREAGY